MKCTFLVTAQMPHTHLFLTHLVRPFLIKSVNEAYFCQVHCKSTSITFSTKNFNLKQNDVTSIKFTESSGDGEK